MDCAVSCSDEDIKQALYECGYSEENVSPDFVAFIRLAYQDAEESERFRPTPENIDRVLQEGRGALDR